MFSRLWGLIGQSVHSYHTCLGCLHWQYETWDFWASVCTLLTTSVSVWALVILTTSWTSFSLHSASWHITYYSWSARKISHWKSISKAHKKTWMSWYSIISLCLIFSAVIARSPASHASFHKISSPCSKAFRAGTALSFKFLASCSFFNNAINSSHVLLPGTSLKTSSDLGPSDILHLLISNVSLLISSDSHLISNCSSQELTVSWGRISNNPGNLSVITLWGS